MSRAQGKNTALTDRPVPCSLPMWVLSCPCGLLQPCAQQYASPNEAVAFSARAAIEAVMEASSDNSHYRLFRTRGSNGLEGRGYTLVPWFLLPCQCCSAKSPGGEACELHSAYPAPIA